MSTVVPASFNSVSKPSTSWPLVESRKSPDEQRSLGTLLRRAKGRFPEQLFERRPDQCPRRRLDWQERELAAFDAVAEGALEGEPSPR